MSTFILVSKYNGLAVHMDSVIETNVHFSKELEWFVLVQRFSVEEDVHFTQEVHWFGGAHGFCN